LLKKAVEELKFCEDKTVTPEILVRECLIELEKFGFLNLMHGESEEHLYKIKDMRKTVKGFVVDQLKQTKTGTGMNFD
jgi:hypothetical protein